MAELSSQSPLPLLSSHVGHVLTISAAFRQQKQLVYGTLDSQNDLQRAIVQVSNDVKSAEAVSRLPSFLRFLFSSTHLFQYSSRRADLPLACQPIPPGSPRSARELS
jgi:hypothetical protein